MKARFCMFFMVLVVSMMLSVTTTAIEYPGRQESKYQQVPYIEIADLYQDYLAEKVIIVDVRSQLEYETIHIDGALHIPVGNQAFETEVKKLAKTNPGMRYRLKDLIIN